MIGVPTSLSAGDVENVRFRHAALFDYRDEPAAQFGDSDQSFLKSVTGTFLRPWVEPHWDNGVNRGVLPNRRSRMLPICLRLRRLCTSKVTVSSRDKRDLDVFFAGTGTALNGVYNQRIEWLREIEGQAFRFWGGIIDSPALNATAHLYGDIRNLILRKKRLTFWSYFRKLLQSQVALTPAGFARWSYRQYEAIYAGAILVSADFRDIRTLIPLPIHGMIHVRDHEPVVPAIHSGIALRKEQPDIVNENILSLESFLELGDYSRKKPALLDVFESQLKSA